MNLEFQLSPIILAYFDPSSGSLLIQALAGGAAGLAVLIRYMYLNYFSSRKSISSDPPKNTPPQKRVSEE